MLNTGTSERQIGVASKQVPSGSGTDVSPLRIAGFGGCLISGYPNKAPSLFEVACDVVQQELSIPIQRKLISLHGRTAPRAEKYLSQVLTENPQFVLFQFGASDVVCAVRQNSASAMTSKRSSRSIASRGESSSKREVANSIPPYSELRAVRWEITSLVAAIRKLEPVTPLASYNAAMKRMIDSCLTAGAVPVILSPAVFGHRYVARRAVSFGEALSKIVADRPNTVFIDCLCILKDYHKSLVLLGDGVHLTEFAQELIGKAAGGAIVAHLRSKA